MKSIAKLRFLALAALLLTSLALPGRAHAAFMLTIAPSGNDVVVNGTGSFNLTALTLFTSGATSGGGINPSKGILRGGPFLSDDIYDGGGLTDPASVVITWLLFFVEQRGCGW